MRELTDKEICNLIKSKELSALERLIELGVDKNCVFDVLYNMKTYKFLVDLDTEFYLRGNVSIETLVELELKQDMTTWNMKVFGINPNNH